MPHYRDGTEAKVGDVVRGRGYNVAYEIVGVVKRVVPGATSCNIEVVHAVPGHNDGDPTSQEWQYARLNTEYGEAAEFEKVA